MFDRSDKKNNIFRKFNIFKNKGVFSNAPIHETWQIAILLAMTGGFVDTYTYMTRGGVFAYAETGNIIFFTIHLANGDLFKASYYLIPISVFFLGVWITEYIKKFSTSYEFIKWEHAVIILEAALLFIIGFLPKDFPNSIVIMLVALISSMQMNSFRKFEGMIYVTNMCTGNLRSAAEHLFSFMSGRDKIAAKKSARYFLVILFFAIGSFMGAFLTDIFFEKSIWVCCLLLVGIELIMIFGK